MLFVQYIVPQKWLTKCVARLTRCRWGKVTTAFIRWFVKRYQVDMSIADEPNIESYLSFNAFFTRALRAGVRPIQAQHDGDLISPVDGAVSEFGPLKDGQLLQAKGCYYTVETLLGGGKDWTQSLSRGHFITAYLSPRDYHRIHMPIDGQLESMHYVPGRLFSVNQQAVAGIPGVFARNERVVCLFSTKYGRLAVILVGAMLVGNMETVWHGSVNANHSNRANSWTYNDKPVHLKQGDELGRFNMGSTVILLTENPDFTWLSKLKPDLALQMGECLGSF